MKNLKKSVESGDIDSTTYIKVKEFKELNELADVKSANEDYKNIEEYDKISKNVPFENKMANINKVKNINIKLCYTVEDIFNNVINNITDIKTDNIKYPDKIFYFNNNKYVAEYNNVDRYIRCDYENFWRLFELKNISFNNTRLLIINFFNIYFRLECNRFFTLPYVRKKNIRFGIMNAYYAESYINEIENYFNDKEYII